MNKRYTLEAAREAARLAAADPAHLGAGRQLLPDLLRRTARRRSRQRPHRRDPGREDLRAARPAAAPGARRSRSSRRRRRRERATFPEFRKVQLFRPTGGGIFLNPLPEDGELWPSRSSTRTDPGARWRSNSTKPSPAAISGPSWRRRSAAQQPRLQPPRLELLEDDRQRRGGADPGARRAVVVGVVQEQDVPGAGAGGRAARDRVRRRPARPSPSPTATTAPAASRGGASRAGPTALKIP